MISSSAKFMHNARMESEENAYPTWMTVCAVSISPELLIVSF